MATDLDLDLDIDLLDPAFYADLDGMHAAFTEMRKAGPVWRAERNGLWAIVGHAAVIDVERRARTFSSATGYRSFHSPGEDNMIAQDNPAHAEQRRLVADRFTPKGVPAFEGKIRALVVELVDRVAQAGEVEVVDALAAQLPCRLTAHLLGFPEDRWRDIKSWSERLMRYDAIHSDTEAFLGMMGAIQEFSEVLNPLVESRRSEPVDDLVSVWATSEIGGCPMADHTIMNETGLFISGGAETTRTVIARGLAKLAEHPDQWEAMADDPSLVARAVEELIRWVTPLNNFFRTATEDTTVAGTPIVAGERVILLYPSANRDEGMFADPFVFDVAREPNPHVAFGFGPHVCLGMHLARLELRILFKELTRRLTNLRVVEAPELEANIFATAVKSMRLAADPR
ncbi:MAG: cytochrome P450 [Acidimicrobiia bacterium]